jgi:hypothetical protein
MMLVIDKGEYMTKEQRDAIENSMTIQVLVNSDAWGKDNKGYLETLYYKICSDLGIAENVASEWLHE